MLVMFHTEVSLFAGFGSALSAQVVNAQVGYASDRLASVGAKSDRRKPNGEWTQPVAAKRCLSPERGSITNCRAFSVLILAASFHTDLRLTCRIFDLAAMEISLFSPVAHCDRH